MATQMEKDFFEERLTKTQKITHKEIFQINDFEIRLNKKKKITCKEIFAMEKDKKTVTESTDLKNDKEAKQQSRPKWLDDQEDQDFNEELIMELNK